MSGIYLFVYWASTLCFPALQGLGQVTTINAYTEYKTVKTQLQDET